MIGFYVICAMLVATALAFILPPLLKGAPLSGVNTAREANLAVYRSQIAEMESDLRNGLIEEEQLELDREELQRRLLEDVSAERGGSRVAKPAAASRRLYLALAIGLPLAAGLLYMNIGDPKAIPEIRMTK